MSVEAKKWAVAVLATALGLSSILDFNTAILLLQQFLGHRSSAHGCKNGAHLDHFVLVVGDPDGFLVGPSVGRGDLDSQRVECTRGNFDLFFPCDTELEQFHLLLLHVEVAKGSGVAFGKRQAADHLIGPAASAKIGPPRSAAIGVSCPFIFILPVALFPAKSTIDGDRPLFQIRFAQQQVPFSSVAVSVADPIGVSMVSVAVQGLRRLLSRWKASGPFPGRPSRSLAW